MCIRDSFAKVGYYESGCIHLQPGQGYHPLLTGLRQEHSAGEFRFGSGSVHCVAVLQTFPFPFIGSNLKGEVQYSLHIYVCMYVCVYYIYILF